ncbi:MAG: NTP transferase domain-containing protein [Chloroflexi bacterium]|nr:NTP transferase domain-containing protein [Chloroflexota bacterium]
MIGIIPAAGRARRLGNKCKALIKVNGKPIIEHIIQNMIPLVKKIIIIVHGNEIEKAIGDEYLNVPIIYVQQKRRKGIAHAIYQCRKKVKEDMLIILGDIIYIGDLKLKLGKSDFLFGVQEVEDKSLIKKSYGILNEKPMKVIEKPLESDLDNLLPVLGLGIYMATPKLFDYIKLTKPNERTGEIEFTDTINLIPSKKCKDLHGFYTNINSEKDLKNANNYSL